jgi:predicted RNA binding protein YcfA (HicA-like mRNA interferase family)
MPTKVREMLEILRHDGWVQVGQTGSHRQFRHPVKPGRVTVAGKPAKDLPREVHRSILLQAGLKR